LHDKDGSHRGLPYNFFMERYTASYCNEMIDFIHAIQNDLPVPIDAEDALQATKIALAANLSLKKNKPIAINE
jgi:myo-inositol 2-dehydrogenase/D-chiro-inositol 1-dehydrogenase